MLSAISDLSAVPSVCPPVLLLQNVLEMLVASAKDMPQSSLRRLDALLSTLAGEVKKRAPEEGPAENSTSVAAAESVVPHLPNLGALTWAPLQTAPLPTPVGTIRGHAGVGHHPPPQKPLQKKSPQAVSYDASLKSQTWRTPVLPRLVIPGPAGVPAKASPAPVPQTSAPQRYTIVLLLPSRAGAASVGSRALPAGTLPLSLAPKAAAPTPILPEPILQLPSRWSGSTPAAPTPVAAGGCVGATPPADGHPCSGSCPAPAQGSRASPSWL
eukprot:RCo023659